MAPLLGPDRSRDSSPCHLLAVQRWQWWPSFGGIAGLLPGGQPGSKGPPYVKPKQPQGRFGLPPIAEGSADLSRSWRSRHCFVLGAHRLHGSQSPKQSRPLGSSRSTQLQSTHRHGSQTLTSHPLPRVLWPRPVLVASGAACRRAFCCDGGSLNQGL